MLFSRSSAFLYPSSLPAHSSSRAHGKRLHSAQDRRPLSSTEHRSIQQSADQCLDLSPRQPSQWTSSSRSLRPRSFSNHLRILPMVSGSPGALKMSHALQSSPHGAIMRSSPPTINTSHNARSRPSVPILSHGCGNAATVISENYGSHDRRGSTPRASGQKHRVCKPGCPADCLVRVVRGGLHDLSRARQPRLGQGCDDIAATHFRDSAERRRHQVEQVGSLKPKCGCRVYCHFSRGCRCCTPGTARLRRASLDLALEACQIFNAPSCKRRQPGSSYQTGTDL